MFILTVATFLLLLYYSQQILSSFILQFSLTDSPFMVAGLLSSFILLFFQTDISDKTGIAQIVTLYQPLVSKRFWIKFFSILIILRQFIIFLEEVEQDILIVMLYDYLSIIAPLIIFMLCLGLAHKISAKLSSAILIPFIIIGILTPTIIATSFASESWTFVTDIKRPYSRFITQYSRTLLKKLNILTKERIIDTRVNQLNQIISKYQSSAALTIQDIFTGYIPENTGLKIKLNKRFPYIFLFIADGVFAGHTTPYGYKRDTTPFLNKFQDESVLFSSFQASSSATGLSIKSLFSGFYRGNNERVDEYKQGSLCQSLTRQGYKSLIAGWSGCKSVFDIKDKHITYLNQAGKRPEDREIIWKYISENPGKKLFAYVHVKGGHGPWLLDDKDKIFGTGKVDIYDALLFKADKEFEQFVRKLKDLNIYDQSIVIFTSDHGIGLGYKYNDFTIYSNMYNVNMHIPFLIKLPGILPKTIENQYSLVDIRPTLEEIIGYKTNTEYHGRSFLNELFSNQTENDRCVFGIATYSDRLAMKCPNGIRVAYDRDRSFINIYNVDDDPYEQNDLIDIISEKGFRKIVDPFAMFLGFWNQTYEKND